MINPNTPKYNRSHCKSMLHPTNIQAIDSIFIQNTIWSNLLNQTQPLTTEMQQHRSYSMTDSQNTSNLDLLIQMINKAQI